MKKLYASISIFLTTSLISISIAQIPLMPEAKAGYEQRIREEVFDINMIDTHEHLFAEEMVLSEAPFDFTLLFQHYMQEDFVSSGMNTSLKKILSNENKLF